VAERQFGPYRLVKQIAVGGMAEIHLAKTKGIAGFEKYVALKMIHPNFAEDEQFIQMLVDEAKIAVHLTHANIAQTFDLGRVGDTYYITMEYVDGSDLYKILRRASEIDIEMPLDVCAFVGKEMLQALDHAHRKRDHTGKALGIVHRDVSPQNVLLSYAGEVKLVDFGIAKATSKAKQTAVGVIKGKYYYMSPEQAWGDPLDHRSDIFSAGIVIYEMMTGQMLYLEEDLHRLLDMVRKADIAPPSRLRKGIPPQLERIVMHALAKVPGERYQSAGDFATDLERFLHGYAPAFSGSKVAAIMRKVIGDPQGVPADEPEIEIRSGAMSTQELDASQLARATDELERDENSMIFSIDELQAKQPMKSPAQQAPKPKQPTGPAPVAKPAPPKQPTGGVPAIRPVPVNQVKPLPSVKPAAKPAAKPRARDEETRELAPGDIAGAALGTEGDSGLLALTPPPGPATAKRSTMAAWDSTGTEPGDDDLENIGERTMITAPDFLQGVGGGDDDGHEGGEATMITQAPRGPDLDGEEDDETTGGFNGDDEGPTMQRDFSKPAPRVATGKKKAPAPPALAAKIQTPAVSAIRTPKPSRRTPPGGVPTGNVLQAIVNAAPAEAMPTPSRAPKKTAPPPLPTPPLQPAPPPPQDTGMPPQQQWGQPQPPPQQQGWPQQPQQPQYPPQQQPWGQPPQQQPWPQQQQPWGQPPSQMQQWGQQPQYPPQPGWPQQAPMSPQAMYPVALYGSGSHPPHPATLTGALRLTEGDEIPTAYKLDSKRRWFGLVIGGIIAISVAAGVTFLIIRGTRDSGPTEAKLEIDSTPRGATVTYDGNRLSGVTPMTIEHVPVGTQHDIEVKLALYKPFTQQVDIPKSGETVTVTALLEKLLGKIAINTKPSGAEIRINGEIRGRTPTTLTGIDMATARTLDIRLKDYQPYTQNLEWPANGQIDLDLTLQATR